MIIVKESSLDTYLLHHGKLVLCHTTNWQAQKLPVIRVDDVTFGNFVTAYGAPVGE